MGRKWEVSVAGVLLLTMGIGGQTNQGGKYLAAGIARWGEIAYPPNSRTTGIVILDVSVDASGIMQKVEAVLDVPPLTSAVESGLQSWKFTPATLDGRAQAGTVRLVVVFNPSNPGGVAIPSGSLQPADGKSGATNGEYQPPQLKSGRYAVSPPNTVPTGTVMLALHLGSEGRVEGVRVLRWKGVVAGAATRAVKDWEFAPASYRGAPVESQTPVAFVFLPAAGTL
jgi:Gram-negative bacterial TonB protein C-terminal